MYRSTVRRWAMIFIGILVVSMTVAPPVWGESSGMLTINIGEATVGQVLSLGVEDSDRDVCIFPPTLGWAQVSDSRPFIEVEIVTTSDCKLVVSEVCLVEQLCGSSPESDESGVMNLHGDSAQAEDRSSSSNETASPLGHCTSRATGHSRLWTEGFATDDLTSVELEMIWDYNCEWGQASMVSWEGGCWWFSENGWQANYCIAKQNGISTCCGAVEEGVEGEFECHNSNFCSDNDYLHTLYTDAEGTNGGFLNCEHIWSGTMPPAMRMHCEKH